MKQVVLFVLIIFIYALPAQNFFWAKNLGSRPLAATTNTAGDILTTGNFAGVVDFDPGVGTSTLGAPSATYTNLFISKSDAAGNFITAYGVIGISGQGNITAYAIKTDLAGNIYLSGKYVTAAGGSIDFDPGPGTYTVASLVSNQTVCFILKLNATGNLIWVKSLEGTGGVSTGISITLDASGNVFTSGRYTGTTDFDPGIGTYTLSASPTINSSFVLKLDALGNFVFAKDIAGTANVFTNEMCLDPSGNLFFTGQYQGTADFDPGIGSYTLTSAGGNDIFVLKLDALGNFIWAKSMGGTGSNYANSIAVDTFGNSHLTGATSGTADFDPGIGTYTLTSAAPADIFILKLDVLGNFVWVKTMGNAAGALHLTSVGNSVDLDPWGNVYTTGSVGGNAPVDFDPGPGAFMLSVNSASMCSYISELDASGNFIWAGTMGGGSGKSVRVHNSGVYVAGYYNSGIQDLDPTFGTYTVNGFSDGYILKLSAASSISGPVLFCNNNGSATATYSVVNVPGNTYSWTVSPGAVINTAANTWSVNLTLASGPTSIAVTITNFSVSTTRSVIVNVAAPPSLTINAVPSLSICPGSTLALTGTGASTFVWSGGIVNNATFQPAASDNYIFTGLSANGCTAALTASMIVYPFPAIVFTVAPAYTVCSGYTVSLGQIGANILTYTFSNGVSNNTPFTLWSSAIYTVTGTGLGGCTSTFSVQLGAIPGPSLSVTVSPSATVCAGSTVNLNASGSPSTYSWSGGILNNVPFVPASSNVYTVTSTGTNNCIGRAMVPVVVNPLPNVGALIVPSIPVCIGSTLVLSGTGAATYSWSGGIVNNFPFTAVSYTAYVVSGTSANGCVNSSTIPITVNPLPNVGVIALPSLTVCSGSTLNLSGTGASTYTWSGGITNNLTFVTTSSTVYTVSGVSSSGCVNTATIPITVNFLPIIGAVILPSANVCAGSTLNLSGTGASTYTWSGGIVNNSSFNAMASTVYTLSGTDANGCKNNHSVTVTVNPLPVLGFVALPSLSICAGSSLSLSGTGASTYTWSNGVLNNISFVPANTTTYDLNGTGANGCTNSLSLIVVVNPQPVFISQPLSQTLAIGAGTQFTVASSNINSTFLWQQNTGSGFVNLVNGPQFSGVNTATLVLSNVNLAQNNDAFRCIVSEGNCLDTSNVALLNVYDATGIAESENENHFTLSPNPANEACNIFLSKLVKGLSYLVTDQTGRTVLSGNIEDTQTRIDLHTLAYGLYFIGLNKSNQKPMKLIKE